jgi:hypothetical protein
VRLNQSRRFMLMAGTVYGIWGDLIFFVLARETVRLYLRGSTSLYCIAEK